MSKLVSNTLELEKLEDSGLVSKIRSHPTLAFFVLTFLVSWAVWFIAPLASGLGNIVYNTIIFIGASGPAFAALIVAGTINPEPSDASRKKRLTAFAAVFAVTYVLPPLFELLLTGSVNPVLLLTSLMYSTVAAYIVSSVYHPKQGIATLMAGLKRVSAKSIWIWVAVLLPFVWQIVAAAIDMGFGGQGLLAFSGNALLLALVAYPTTFFFGGPLQEEPGWRGFATPRLQQRFSPLAAGLIVGLAWSIWHFPLYFQPFYGGGLGELPIRLLTTVPLGVIFTWLYNRSGGNLFASMLLHCSINTSAGLFADSGLIVIALIIITAVIVAVSDKMYRKNGNPLVQQMAKKPSRG